MQNFQAIAVLIMSHHCWPLVCQYSHGCVVVFSYFNEPWAMAIYHDRFSDFRDEVRELLISRPVRILP